MPKIADAYVLLYAKTDQYKKGIAQAKRTTTGFAKSARKSFNQVTVGLSAMTIAVKVAAAAIAIKLTRAIIRAGRSVLQTAVKYDKLKLGLLAVAGSSAEARRQLARLQDVAKLPGLSFAEAIQGSTALQAAGLSAKLAERSLKAFGNALVTVGKGAADLKGVNLALTQIVTKGTGFGQELRQLSERLPQVRKAMKDAFGIGSVEDFKKLGLSAEAFIEGIVREFEKLPKVTGTVANDLENLAIAFDRLKDQIGQTMLKAASESSKSLTNIIDKIRLVIESYIIFRDEAALVFRDVAKIAFRMTGEMAKGMIRIIRELAKVIWVPLKYAALGTMRDITDGFEIGMNNLAAKIGIKSKEVARLQENTVKNLRFVWDQQRKAIEDIEIDRTISKGVAAIEADLDGMFKTMMTGFDRIDTRLSTITNKVEDARMAWAALQEGLLNIARAFGLIGREVAVLQAIKPEEIEFLKLKTEDPKKNVGRILEAEKRIRDFRRGVFEEFDKRAATNLANFQAFTQRQREELEKRRQQWRDFGNEIQGIFENMFRNILSGDTKNLWESFWEDIKQMIIRKLAQAFASQILTGMLPGMAGGAAGGAGLGSLFGGVGAGAALAGLGPALPVIAGIGGAALLMHKMTGDSKKEGRGYMGPTQVNVYGQDLANLDEERLRKTVEQRIVPMLKQAEADGLA